MRAVPRGLRATLITLLLGLALCPPAHAGFDYWVLALSWSPEYCASDAARPNSRQCALPREFIVHGLWPQYERGYPEFCDTQARVPERTAERLAPLMPDPGLVYYQWKKHGSCSGLSTEAYFAQLERAARSIRIPRAALQRATQSSMRRIDLERAFIDLNPGLREDAISFECRRQNLREVRICLNSALKPRRCGTDIRERCNADLRVRSSGG